MEASTTMTVRCAKCHVEIQAVTRESMVYCLRCRKWCKEVNEAINSVVVPLRPQLPRKRRLRCH